ncbi:hypothetical protein [Vibrio kanaloae]|uniref:hypothetical protein n=1 Tax=Vibrio kanaloae TaxID=170673 RepID=UPI00098930E6|nr:hypothetical protein [Vibrio kanaloae]QPK06514.1 hypothetical protein BTD91_15230 [Vibrio kanaloae]
MFSWFKQQDDSDRLLKIMKENRNRVTISSNGVVRLNLQNEEVMDKIRADMEKLKELDKIKVV